MVLPWIAFLPALIALGFDDMGDIIDLCIKEFEGKLRENEKALATDTTGTLATLTANTGKDMYLAYAKINIAGSTTNNNCKIELQVNGVVKDTFDTETPSGNYGPGTTVYEFAVGFKVTTGQVIKLECTVNDSCRIESVIQCFEEDTLDSPQIPPLKPV